MTARTTLLALATLALAASAAPARQVEVPLQFDHEFIRQALLTEVYTSPGGSAVVWDNGTGCGYLKLREPSVNSSGNRVRVVTRGEARVGTPIGDRCLAPLQWEGFIEALEEPRLSNDQPVLQFRVVESNIYDTGWKKGFFTGKLWDLVKTYVQPRFEAVRIDLNVPLQDLRGVLPLLVGRGDSARIAQILDSIRLTGASVTDTGVTVALTFAVNPLTPQASVPTTSSQATPSLASPPPAAEPQAVLPQATPPTSPPPSPEPTLSAEELQRWEEAWQRWDAFLTFVVKQAGHDASAKELQQALTDVLIEARYDILQALAPTTPGAPDPTRALFLQTWERLAPVMRRSALTLPGTVALRYMSFIAAGDALAALDQAGPDIGLDISADGLRRLARIVAPLSTEDPLAYSAAVDPDLRQLFGLGPPLPAPDLSGATDEVAWWRQWFTPRRAMAVEEHPAASSLQKWIADPDAIDAYLQAVHEVLDEVTKQTLASADLEERKRDVYRRLVLATAWQESCWRQFVREHAKVTYIKSAVGSTGMMQVNEHVWRGLYDLRGLRWDIRYNGRAGAEILLRYLQDYAIARNEDAQPGGIDNLARATYAVYNGGPGHLTRYRKHNTRKSLQRIDDLFWQKYQAVSAGKESGVSHCIVGGSDENGK